MSLPERFLSLPLAHRALHGTGRPENSRAAIRAAIAAGYGIELDLQLSADGRAMVFHDYDLGRLTAESGPLRQRSAAELAKIGLSGGDEGIPSLREVLALVAGRVPLLLEIKDQDGALGPNVGALEQAVADDLTGYRGDLAVMSFNPHAVAAFGAAAPNWPRGLVTGSFDNSSFPTVPKATRDHLHQIPDFEAVGACFISHDAQHLDMAPVQALKARGVPLLCWTIRSAQAEAQARKTADNITFEAYLPNRP